MSQSKIILGAFVPGVLTGAAWRLPEAPKDSFRSFEHYRYIAEKLEAGRFHSLFFNDGVKVDLDPGLEKGPNSVRWDPLVLAPALATVTRHIGLIATASTTYNEPYNVARKYASLDHLSNGRAGWNLVTSLGGGENFNRSEHTLHGDRHERAEEFYDVVSGLWDSWDDDAFVQDKASGTWLDSDKLHLLEHQGKYFQVKGPLNVARPIQGHPVIAQAGSSEAGIRLGARVGELIFTAQQTVEESRDFYENIKGQAVAFGRSRDHLKVLPGISPVVGSTQAEAEAKYQRLQELLDPQSFLSRISKFASLDYDLAELPFDDVVPLPPENFSTDSHPSRQKLVYDLIRRERPTVRQLFDKLTAGGHRVLIGTPESIADDLQHWFEAGAADGFNVMFSGLHAGIDDFVDGVVPELQRRGLFQREYVGATLRENLGLPYRHNRHR
ncbi:LLM class flavin-dependent oxidoreductase [Stutzerimonas kirkiae]|uniref:Nitrilotriacetate monooxygenase n=1 Tax=Stutzerimonas kirkiae TaxID=2211392 RepID=A0A4V2KDF0_9GAMM|nr:LLM class flavin-dependent oxidoreductase [Stutzerimonas kirkiae]TBU98965.1 nitrilotriacetate monooxygenase [Stutzerimonas kirkiae]TBV01615.1 nitrilotriacetate monooxygenase [Stutzerimonas kirkiae]TBV10281.1 nitrilotriacetate monooxygenase [Stutzerimonas kirkiae]